MKTLNIMGAGRLGQTLGYLWQQQGLVKIGAVVTRQLVSAEQASEFIGAGLPHTLDHLHLLPRADYWLLACPDDQIQSCCERLVQAGCIETGQCVLHCSGALTANETLISAKAAGAFIASIHPIKSFAQPALAVQSFAGTYCGMEGDADALALTVPLFTALGAHCFLIKAEAKTLYHAASVIACNYLVALQELALQTYAQAGVERTQALAILNPIVTQTVQAIFQLDTTRALTGPIARGDQVVVHKQYQALQAWNPDYAEIYQGLGKIALQLAQHQGQLSAEQQQALAQTLDL